MKKSIFIIAGILLVAIGIILVVRGSEDAWICKNGEWIKHGNPSNPMPAANLCKSENQEEDIIVFSPNTNETISNPVIINGKARGSWFFEASFPAELVDASGNVIGTGIMQAKSDWMTEDFVDFEGTIAFNSSNAGQGKLVLKKDNPSGLPEYDKSFEVPVSIPKNDTIAVKVYFNNSKMDPEFSCNKVFAIEREIVKTQTIGRAALEELLKGPAEAEKEQGYLTSINAGVKINSLTIENGLARVDFDEQLEFQVGGSCRVSAIRAQITETLKQFETVDRVIISINNRTEDILQP